MAKHCGLDNVTMFKKSRSNKYLKKQTIASLTFVVVVILQAFSSFPQPLSSFAVLYSFLLQQVLLSELFLQQIEPL